MDVSKALTFNDVYVPYLRVYGNLVVNKKDITQVVAVSGYEESNSWLQNHEGKTIFVITTLQGESYFVPLEKNEVEFKELGFPGV